MFDRAILIVDPDHGSGAALAEAVRTLDVVADHLAEIAPAKEAIASGKYDLLVAEVELAVSDGLDLLRHATATVPHVPVVLLGGEFPAAAAADIIAMPVVRFVVRPFDRSELAEDLTGLASRSLRSRIVGRVQSRLELCLRELQQAELGEGPESRVPRGRTEGVSIPTLRMLADSLSDVMRLRQTLAPLQDRADVCQLLDCPRRSVQAKALWEAVDVLQQTRSKFKSRELGQLRNRLESVLKEDVSCCAP